MDKKIFEAWDEKKETLKQALKETTAKDMTYQSLLQQTLEILGGGEGMPDPHRMHCIDGGDDRGTLLFVIAEPGNEHYWITEVDYGSCSYCDSLGGIVEDIKDKPNDKETDRLWMLCLHMIQEMRKIADFYEK